MRKKVLSTLLSLCLLLGLMPTVALADESSTPTPAPVYVSATGDDAADKGDGTQEKPYATLAKAVYAAEDGATIYVTSDLTMSECARYYGKHLTIIGQPGENDADGVITVTRGDTFATLDDTNRSWYNPAMIEVGGAGPQTASLALYNIIFDDAGLKEGTRYLQAPVTDLSSKAIVQDAIIATYNNTATITLGKGAVLKNFGGMSAVRIADGILVMESGSKITDDSVTDRTKSLERAPIKDYGAAGAVWMQGGSFTMEEGAEISGIVGRAIYADGGTATINGTISNIKSDADMWNGCQGVAIHLRNCATASVGGTIQNVKSTDNNSVVVWCEMSSFILEKGATIQDCKGTNKYGAIIYTVTNNNEEQKKNFYSSITLNGAIMRCESSDSMIYIANLQTPFLIGELAQLTQNTGKRLIYDGTAANSEAEIEIRGTIVENTCSVLFYGSNNGRPVILTGNAKVNNNDVTSAVFGFGTNRCIVMEASSEICNNKVANGAVVAVNGEGNCFTMKGGSIFGNTVENGSLFAFTSGSWQQPSTLAIKGGTISNNTVPRMFTITSGGKVPGIDSYLEVNAIDPDTYFQQDGKTVTVNPGTKLGNADDQQAKYAWPDQPIGQNPRCVATLNQTANDYGWNSAFATFWAQNTNGTPVTVKMDAPAEGGAPAVDTAKAVYALLLATDEKGAPESGAKIVALCAKVDAEGNISFNLPGNTNGYAVALVQPSIDYGTLTIAANPTSLDESDSAESYTVNYTATFQASTSLMKILNVDKETLNVLKFAPALDSRLTLNGEVSAPTVGEETVTWTFQATLNSDDFVAGESLFTGGVVSAMVGNTAVNVPAAPAETQMVGLCTVTFDANGGAFSDGGETKEVRTVSGKTVANPTAPTRSGYTFEGWNTAANGSGTPFTAETTVDGDKTVYAQWSKNTSGGGGGGGSVTRYTLTYESNGGTTYPSETYSSGKTVKLDKVPTREGYTFTGWYADKGTTDKISSVTMNGNKTVYAGWEFNGALNAKDHVAYVHGYTDGTVGPNRNITRAETAVMLYRLLTPERSEEITTTNNSFSDVPASAWYSKEVSSMANGGYVTGYSDGTFGGDKSITRAEFVTMMVRFVNPAEGTKTFTDVPETYWAYQSISTATAAGWIAGYSDGSFGPEKLITRAEVMTIINRVLNRGVDEDSELLDFKQWPDNKSSDWFYYDVIEATNGHEYTGSRPSENWTKILK